MQRIRNKIVAWLSALSILTVALVGSLALPAVADGEYFTLGETNANLFVNVNQEIEVQDISVVLNGERVNGNDVSWQSSDPAVSIANGVLKVSQKGIFQVTVANSVGQSTQVNVLAKLTGEDEYVLYEEDFEDIANGTLPEGWVVTKADDVNPDAAEKPDVYVDSPQVQNGKLYVGNGVVSKDTYVLLPEYLDAFSDYVVDMDFKQTFVCDKNNGRFAGLLVRVNRNTAGDTTTFGDAYYTLARRAATGSTGLEICGVGGGSLKGANQNNLGATRNWDGTVDWPRDAYDMHMTTKVQGMRIAMDLYRLPNQPNFDGDLAADTDGYQGSVKSPVIETTVPNTWKSQLVSGGVGLRTGGSQMAVDSIRVTVPVSMLDGNPDSYIPSSDQGGEDAVYEDLKFGVISDLHISSKMETGADTHTVTMLEYFKKQNVDAVLITGDVATTGLEEEYQKFNDIWDSVFTDPAAAPEKIVMTGNHEFEQAYYGRETVEDVYRKYMEAYGYDSINRNVVVGGYHFITLTSESAAVDGQYTQVTTDWLKEQLDAAVAENPYQPIFVSAHQSLPNTTYGSTWGATKTQALYDLLKNCPQVVYFAGHSHYPTENERSIYQKDFTCIDVTSLQYSNNETGSAVDAYSVQGGLLVSVEGANRQVVVDRLRVRGDAGNEYAEKVKQPWKLPLPLAKKTFAYTDARKDQREAPTFAADAAVTVSDVTINSLTVTFPSATHDDYVQGYTVYIKEKASGEEMTSKYFISDFYHDLDSMAETQKTEISGLLPNMEYIVEVTAVESFGLESKPITAEFSTLPVTEPSGSINRADFLDVDFLSGFADNSPYRLSYELYGSSNESRLVQSETLGRQVLSANGWINYSITPGMLSKITDSLTMEIAFMVPDEVPKSQCLFGNPEAGGVSIEFSGAGVLQVGMYIDGWKYVKLDGQIQPDTWYHLVATFDGAEMKAYLNGAEAGTTAAAGSIKHNTAVHYMTIGANVNASGNGASKFVGEIALARIYTNALNAEETAQSYRYFLNDACYQTVYEDSLTLQSLTDEQKGDFADEVAALIAEAEQLTASADLDAGKADAFHAKYTALIEKISSTDPSINWKVFEDTCADYSMLTEKSAHWQIENNKEIKKQFFSKNLDEDEYLIYTVDGYIRQVDVSALLYAGFGSAQRDFAVYLSKDGSTWQELVLSVSPEVNDPIYEPGDAVAWKNSSIAAAKDVGGDYRYMKLVLKKFDNGVTWSAAVDNVRILYSDKADDIPLADGTFVDQQDAWDFEDELTSWDKVAEKTGNWDLFANHAETGLSVAGRKDTAQNNTLIYTAPDGKVIDAAEIRLQMAKGFVDLGRDFALEARAAGSDEWVPVTLTLGEATSLNDTYEAAAAAPSAALPADTEAVRLTLKNDIAWTLMIDAVRLGFADKGTTPPVTDEWDLEDELTNWNLVDDRSLGWQSFPNHPETGLSVIGRTDATLEAFIAYRPEKKSITDLKIALMLIPDYFMIDRDIRVSVRASGSDEWTVLSMNMSDPAEIPNAANPAFKLAELTPAEALPADIAEVKIELLNDVLYTPMLDKVSLKLADSDGETDVPGDEEKEYGFVDEMESFDQVKEKSDNWELFAEHAETGLSVAGKTNARSGYLTYGKDGQIITDFAFDLQAATAHFNLGNHILVKVRSAGSEKWETITMKAASIKAIDGQYSSIRLVPQDTLPENIEEVQLMLYNDVPWTLMVDRVLIDYADGSGEDDRPNTETGVAFPAAVCLLAVLSGGAAMKFARKRNED